MSTHPEGRAPWPTRRCCCGMSHGRIPTTTTTSTASASRNITARSASATVGPASPFTALHLAGVLAQHGIRVALFDWELDAGAHRLRLERLFGLFMPDVRYVRCERPLVHEIVRLQRIVRDERLDYGLFDSIGFACPGPPEAAEHAMAYFRCVRQLGIGSYHIAHVRQGRWKRRAACSGSVFRHNSSVLDLQFVKALPRTSSDGERAHVSDCSRERPT